MFAIARIWVEGLLNFQLCSNFIAVLSPKRRNTKQKAIYQRERPRFIRSQPISLAAWLHTGKLHWVFDPSSRFSSIGFTVGFASNERDLLDLLKFNEPCYQPQSSLQQSRFDLELFDESIPRSWAHTLAIDRVTLIPRKKWAHQPTVHRLKNCV